MPRHILPGQEGNCIRRKICGKVFWVRKARVKTWSATQEEQRNKMGRAVAYAKAVTADPEKYAAYARYAKKRRAWRVFPLITRDYPNGTLFGLQFTRVLSAADSIALVGSSRDSFIEAFHADRAIAANTEKCKAINRQIEGLLEARGFDCILYSNRQEPPDGKPRDAYLVLFPSQIMSALTGEILG